MRNDVANEPERMVITRIFDAPRELVWKAWTEPQYAKQWWGPHGFTTPVYDIDFRVGGTFRICMQTPDGQEFWNAGEYHEIVPYERIVYSMYFADKNGKKVEPAEVGIEHEAIEGANDMVTFEDLGNGKTKLTLTGNETMENARNSGQLEGMNEILDKFTAVLKELRQA